eukprot:6115570-Pyramimonas_sp.AAC.1
MAPLWPHTALHLWPQRACSHGVLAPIHFGIPLIRFVFHRKLYLLPQCACSHGVPAPMSAYLALFIVALRSDMFGWSPGCLR